MSPNMDVSNHPQGDGIMVGKYHVSKALFDIND
jgi:hypothetical protein